LDAKSSMSKKKIILITIPCLFAALLARSCFVSDRPSKLGTVSIPERQVTISLFCKSRPRASVISPYEGEYRIIEVAEGGKQPLYYDLPNTLPADTCDFRVFWYPTNNLLRFHDSGFSWGTQFRSECLLDLGKQILFALVRENGRVYLAKLSLPRDKLSFPQANEKSRVPGSERAVERELHVARAGGLLAGGGNLLR
jgi:hypothetical protein